MKDFMKRIKAFAHARATDFLAFALYVQGSRLTTNTRAMSTNEIVGLAIGVLLLGVLTTKVKTFVGTTASRFSSMGKLYAL